MVTLSRGCIALLLIVACGLGRAQERTTALTGAVRARGAGLSRVKVLLWGADSRQILASSLTGREGRFSFVGLPCGGLSTLTLSRPGWVSRRVRNLQLRCESTLEIKLVLYSAADPPRHPAPPEITDELPWWGTLFGQLQLEDLPNARNIWSLLQTQEPSTVTSRIAIGGLETGEPALFGALGASWTENQYTLNGLNVTDPYQPGLPLLEANVDDLAQFQVVTGTKPAAGEGSGTNVALATPEPALAWHGGARLFYSSGTLQGNNLNSRLAAFGFPGPERMGRLEDGGAQAGGRLPPALGSLPFDASASTQRLDKSLGGFSAPMQARIYRGLVDLTAYSQGSQKLSLFYSGQHVFDSNQGAAVGVAAGATTRANRTFQQLQARWTKTAGPSSVFSAAAWLVNAVIS